MRLVIIESPYSAHFPDGSWDQATADRNLQYAREAMADCFKRGEAPFASHLLYTQPGVLNDRIKEERQQGMEAGFKWGQVSDATVVYIDLGMSNGMTEGMKVARLRNRPVEIRRLANWALKEPSGK